jgi:hypothetical protein
MGVGEYAEGAGAQCLYRVSAEVRRQPELSRPSSRVKQFKQLPPISYWISFDCYEKLVFQIPIKGYKSAP